MVSKSRSQTGPAVLVTEFSTSRLDRVRGFTADGKGTGCRPQFRQSRMFVGDVDWGEIDGVNCIRIGIRMTYSPSSKRFEFRSFLCGLLEIPTEKNSQQDMHPDWFKYSFSTNSIGITVLLLPIEPAHQSGRISTQTTNRGYNEIPGPRLKFK